MITHREKIDGIWYGIESNDYLVGPVRVSFDGEKWATVSGDCTHEIREKAMAYFERVRPLRENETRLKNGTIGKMSVSGDTLIITGLLSDGYTRSLLAERNNDPERMRRLRYLDKYRDLKSNEWRDSDGNVWEFSWDLRLNKPSVVASKLIGFDTVVSMGAESDATSRALCKWAKANMPDGVEIGPNGLLRKKIDEVKFDARIYGIEVKPLETGGYDSKLEFVGGKSDLTAAARLYGEQVEITIRKKR
jgi:hypothetical protein